MTKAQGGIHVMEADTRFASGCLGPTCQTVKGNTDLNTFMIEDDGKMSTRVIVHSHEAKKGHVINTKQYLQLHNTC